LWAVPAQTWRGEFALSLDAGNQRGAPAHANALRTRFARKAPPTPIVRNNLLGNDS
jgi:hypothetical protein